MELINKFSDLNEGERFLVLRPDDEPMYKGWRMENDILWVTFDSSVHPPTAPAEYQLADMEDRLAGQCKIFRMPL